MKAEKSQQILDVISSLNTAYFDIDLIKNDTQNLHIKCFYTCNPDGTIRWVWAAKNSKPDFLKFYHAKGKRAVIFSFLIKLLFLLRLQKLIVKGEFTVYTSNQSVLHRRWALFTGTVGPNRKMILWENNASHNIFHKISKSPKAQLNIQQEAKALKAMIENNRSAFVFPAVIAEEKNCLSLEDVSAGITKTNGLTQLPQNSLLQWCTPTSQKVLVHSNFWQQLKETANFDEFQNDKRFADAFILKLKEFYYQIDNQQAMHFSQSHGDFTPWNIWMKEGKLCLIDFELYKEEMPVLYDVFHFVYQSNILIKHNCYNQIKQELNEIFSKPEWKNFIANHQINIEEAEKLYLLNNVLYYMHIYTQQTNWHVQINWLLNTWSEALSYHLDRNDIRKQVLGDITIYLHNVKYAALKLTENQFTSITEYSDIDICLAKENTKQFIKQLKHHPFVGNVNSRKFTNITQITAQLIDGRLVHIDCIHKLKRRATEFLSVEQVIDDAEINFFGVKKASLMHDMLYTTMFYKLNGANVPKHYVDFYNQQIKNENLDNTKFPISINMNNINNSSSNKGVKGFINKVEYLLDVAKRLIPTKGFIVTFSGVDGAGKSTVIENMKYRIEKKFRKKVIVIRHRPSLLPILSAWKHGKKAAELKAANTLPRQGKNNSKLSSIFRFVYYYADYTFGQLYVYCKYVLRGYVVLYDRYYFDFINDSKRSNISLSSKFTAWWYRFLMKPNFNFFLYASATEILARKKELEANTIEQLTNSYLNLFKKLGARYKHSKYIPIYNKELNLTLDTIESSIK